jgi:hypothetical protein
MRRAVVAITTIVFALVGPKISAPSDRAANEPFVYEPPEGFLPPDAKDASIAAKDLIDAKSDEREWVHALTPGHIVAPRLHLKSSNAKSTVEPADLAKIAEGMPAMLKESGVTWTDVRQETRTRPDKARVGIIEGECTKAVENVGVGDFGPVGKSTAQPVRIIYRRLLFVFPTDEGSAFTTAVYGKDEISKFQPALEATIAKARGVALRVPPPPGWMYFAWGGTGLVIGWIAGAMVEKRGKRTKDEEAKHASSKKDEKE